mmetsp:Transcript_28194/g.47238  ORF Transcript_28194/g.47238 Transcript_28194/m.47238 type:complete len:181 (+) Transcript_28194:160-702(+)
MPGYAMNAPSSDIRTGNYLVFGIGQCQVRTSGKVKPGDRLFVRLGSSHGTVVAITRHDVPVMRNEGKHDVQIGIAISDDYVNEDGNAVVDALVQGLADVPPPSLPGKADCTSPTVSWLLEQVQAEKDRAEKRVQEVKEQAAENLQAEKERRCGSACSRVRQCGSVCSSAAVCGSARGNVW